MTDNKNKTELEIMEIINAIRNSGNKGTLDMDSKMYKVHNLLNHEYLNFDKHHE